MRSIEEIKKDQDQAMFQIGLFTTKLEQFKRIMIQLTTEAEIVLNAMESADKLEKEVKEKAE